MNRKQINTLADWLHRLERREATLDSLAGEAAASELELVRLLAAAEQVRSAAVPGPAKGFRAAARIRILNRVGSRLSSGTGGTVRPARPEPVPALRRAFFGVAAVVTLLIAGIAASIPIQNALPGDHLYAGKILMEDLQLLASSPSEDAILQTRLASNRLTEIQLLIVAGRFEDVDLAVQRYEDHINRALAALVRVAQKDGVQTYPILKHVETELTEYSMTLSELLAFVPAPTQTVLARAIDASQIWSDG